MRMPVLFECVSCGKKHYIAFCSAPEGGVECGTSFVTIFFPSGRDALCPKHAHPTDPGRAAADEARRSRCPTSGQEIDLEEAQREPGSDAPSPGQRRGGGARPSGPPSQAPRPEAATPRAGPRRVPAAPVEQRLESSDDGGSSGEPEYLKCTSCFVIYDRSRNEKCPRCGASRDQAPRAPRDVQSRALESLGEKVTIFVLEQWRPLAVLLGVLVLSLGALAATTNVLLVTTVGLAGVVAALGAGMAGTMVYFRAVDMPYYRNQLGARARAGREARSFVAGFRELKTALVRARASRAAARSGQPLPEGDFVEETSTDLAQGADLGAVPAFAALASAAGESGESIRVRARYAGGHPAAKTPRPGALIIDARGVRFENPRESFAIERPAIDAIQARRLGLVLAVLISVGITALLARLLPPAIGSHQPPDWVARAPQMLAYLGTARTVAIAAAAAIVVLLLLGLVLAPHIGVVVRFRHEGMVRSARFRVTAIAARRLSRAGVIG